MGRVGEIDRVARRLAAIALTAGVGVGALALTPAAGARPHQRPLGVFAISPARSQLVTTGPVGLPPTEVANTTGHPLRVHVAPVLLHQSRGGAFTWSRTPAGLRAARRRLSASVSDFTLGGHGAHTVLTRWTGVDGGRPGYAGVLYRGVPVGAPTGQPVRVITQLLAVDLRGIPGAGAAAGGVTQMGVAEPVAHRLRFTISVRNTGQTFGTPRSVALTIVDAAGRRVLRTPITPGVILPGVTRDFTVQLPRRLTGGRYRAIGSARFAGGAASARSLRFRLDGDGDLPTAQLLPGALTASGEAGRAASVTVPLHNVGSASGAPRGSVVLYRLIDGSPAGPVVARTRLRGPTLRAAARGTAAARLGHLKPGQYQAVVRYAAPVDSAQPAVVDFRATPAQSLLHRALRWLAAHGLLLGLGASLAATAGTLARTRRQARRPRPIRLRQI